MTTATTHLALVGPTASGKSALALAVAEHFDDVELVSVDSMQVYRELDIGTAKPSRAERAAVQHHVIDLVEPTEDWSVVRHQAAARAAIADIESRGKRALLVGGTGLYVQAVIDDLRFPGEDRGVRAEIAARAAQPGGLAAAYDELARLDPSAAAHIDPNNERRIVRALEVIHITGKPFSSFGAGVGECGATMFPVRLAGVWLPRTVLARRIAARIRAMRDIGLVEEVEALVRRHGARVSRTARQAIGYSEIISVLEGQISSVDDAFERALRRTATFARRQRMWFRRDPRIEWFGTSENPAAILPALLQSWSR
ncbi:MAG TPA: tRNA (adenosine(37)-N6)-dimethylallyltransferase MiaA [Acidimicrobiia bacterium]